MRSRAKEVIPTVNSTFQEFYDAAPLEIQMYIDVCADTPQSKSHHPEGDAKTHIQIVFNRAKRSGDFNQMVAAFFHDLGKASTTKASLKNPGEWNAIGHEKISAGLVSKYRSWIEDEIGADFDKVYYIVSQHMRAHQVKDMRPAKQVLMKSHSFWPDVEQFTKYDSMKTDFSNDLE